MGGSRLAGQPVFDVRREFFQPCRELLQLRLGVGAFLRHGPRTLSRRPPAGGRTDKTRGARFTRPRAV